MCLADPGAGKGIQLYSDVDNNKTLVADPGGWGIHVYSGVDINRAGIERREMVSSATP